MSCLESQSASMLRSKAPPPPEDDMPTVAAHKTATRLKRHMNQVVELTATREELHAGNWDGYAVVDQLEEYELTGLG